MTLINLSLTGIMEVATVSAQEGKTYDEAAGDYRRKISFL